RGGAEEVQVGGPGGAAGRRALQEPIQDQRESRVTGGARRVAELPAGLAQRLQLALGPVEARLAIPARLQVLLVAFPLAGRGRLVEQHLPGLEPRALQWSGHGVSSNGLTVPARTAPAL